MQIYLSQFKIWNFDKEKGAGVSGRKSLNINNIDWLAAVQAQEFSLCQKRNFEFTSV